MFMVKAFVREQSVLVLDLMQLAGPMFVMPGA